MCLKFVIIETNLATPYVTCVFYRKSKSGKPRRYRPVFLSGPGVVCNGIFPQRYAVWHIIAI